MRNVRIQGGRFILAGLGVCVVALSGAWAQTQCYYTVTGYAGAQQAGPFSSQSACEQAAAAERAQGYRVGACSCSSAGNSASTPTMNPSLRGAYDFGSALGSLLGQQLHKAIYGDPAAKAAAAAAAAEAARKQEAEIARQQALAEQQRQAMFDRLSHELKMSGFGDLSLKGFDNSSDLQLKGFANTAINAGGDLHLKGFGNQPPTGDTPAESTSLGPQTCFFGECGPTDSGPLEPWNDPKVVDLRDLQQGVDLAVVATKAQPANQRAIMDQALAAANGDTSIQVTIASDTAVPVISEQGLLAFQQANNAYRQAHDSAYQLQQSYQLNQQRRAAVNAIVTQTQQQLEADLRANIDEMTLEQRQFAMAQVFDAALQEELSYGKTWAQYLAARKQYYKDRYELQMYLWSTALGKQGSPSSPPPQLTASTTLSESDLSLVLPPMGPLVAPTKQDLKFLQDLEIEQTAQPPDIITRKVIDELEEEEKNAEISNRLDEGAIADIEHHQEAEQQLAAQPTMIFPPNILKQYRNSPQFAQQMNAEHQRIAAEEQRNVERAVKDADRQWEQKISQWQSQGLVQPDTPLAQQAKSNPQLGTQVTAAQKQVTADLDYRVTRAKYQAALEWQQWMEKEEATLPQPTLTEVEAARD